MGDVAKRISGEKAAAPELPAPPPAVAELNGGVNTAGALEAAEDDEETPSKDEGTRAPRTTGWAGAQRRGTRFLKNDNILAVPCPALASEKTLHMQLTRPTCSGKQRGHGATDILYDDGTCGAYLNGEQVWEAYISVKAAHLAAI